MNFLKLLQSVSLFLIFTTTVCAQNNNIYTYAFKSNQTHLGHIVWGGALGYSHDVTRWLSVEANGQVGISRNHDPVSLIIVDNAYNDRTHLTLDANATAYPIRFKALGLSNRFGISFGPTLRWKKETVSVAGFPGTLSDGDVRLRYTADVAASWDALGPNTSVIYFYYPGGTSPNYPDIPADVTDPGFVYGLMLSNQGFDPGLSAGLAYDVSRDRTTLGLRTAYRRFYHQRALTGSHSLDFSIRVGYRF